MAELVESYACAPLTERGRGILISGDPKSNSIIYCNGRSVIIRYLDRLLHVRVYGEHSYQTTVARYSPNGEWVASADVSGILRIWGVHNDFVLKNEFKVLSGRIDDLQWSPDSLRIVASGDGKGKSFVRVFMWDTGTNVGDFDGHSRRVLSCSFKQTRPFRIATCGEDFSVNFYEGPPFKFKLSNRDHSNFVNCARFSPDGSKFITVGSDKKGILYDGKSGERSGELSSQDCHHGSIYAVSWSPDSKNVLTVSADKSAKVWEISGEGCGGELRKTLESCGSGEIEGMLVGCLWQNDSLITVSLGGCIRVFSAADLDAPPAIVTCGHMKNVTSLAMLHPQTLLSCSYDGSVFTWVRGVGYSARLKRKHNTPIKCFRAVHNHIVLSGFDNKVWRVSIDGEEESSVDVGSQPKDLSISPDFPDLVLVTTDSAIILLRGTEISSTADLAFTATSGALSDDATEAIIGGEDGRLHIYRITSDGLSAQATVVENHHRGAINAISYSPDRSMFASTDLNRGTLIWDRHTDGTKPLPQVRAKDMTYHTARVNCLAWSPDSCRIVTGSLDMSAIVYYIDRPASSRLTISRAHLGGVYGVVFADDSTVVTCGDDAFVRLWNLKA